MGSILFAITVDRPELNKAYQNTLHVGNGGEVIIPGTGDDEPRAVIAGDSSPVGMYLCDFAVDTRCDMENRDVKKPIHIVDWKW